MSLLGVSLRGMRELRLRAEARGLLACLASAAMMLVSCANGSGDDSSVGGDASFGGPPDVAHDGIAMPDGSPVMADGKADAPRGDGGSDSSMGSDSGVAGSDAPADVEPDTRTMDSGVDSEVDTGVDAGGCTSNMQCPMGQVCDTTTHMCVDCNVDNDCPLGQVCMSHTCVPGCNAGHGCPNGEGCCNGQCASLSTTMNCTACGDACDTTHSNGATCTGTTCTYASCQSGYADCNTMPPDLDGCETSLTDPNDCGACGRQCSSTDVQTRSCTTGGLCNSTCLAGFGNCNEPAPPNPDDGCESNLNTCAGTACCGTLCTALHQNGLGNTYSDCVPFGVPGNAATYSANMANEANNAWPDGGFQSTGNCQDPTTGASDACVGQDDGIQAAVWCYQGTIAGYVHLGSDTACGGFPCCPSTSDPTWN